MDKKNETWPAVEPKQARPHDELICELLDSRRPKTEREHAAAREVERLRAEVEKLQRAVPPGYALVPVEPTEDMQMAGDLVPPYPGDEGFGSQPDTLNIYRAMLAAAPKVEPVAQRDAEQRDEALLRQALDALEILRDGLLQMKEHAEDYGKRWAAAYIKELRDLSPGSAEEKFHLLGILQDRLAAVSMGVRKGYAAIIALRERLVKGEQQ